VCPKANKSAIRACKLHENARKELVGQGQEPSPSIFFIILLEPTTVTGFMKSRQLTHRGRASAKRLDSYLRTFYGPALSERRA
jgi:hypothetical protein